MTQLRHVAIAVVLLAGCRKEPPSTEASGNTPPSGGPPAPAVPAAAHDAAVPTPDTAGPVDAGAAPRPAAQGEPCPEGTPCNIGLTCRTYVGVTGRELATCEIPCDQATRCPTGQACVTVFDGPGQVCQPTSGGTGTGGAGGGGTGTGGAGGGGTGKGSAAGGGSPGGGALPAQGHPCASGRCAPGLACIEYYGIAGPRGGAFTSCEIRCDKAGRCPGGQQCTTIADGPGQVCRP